MSYLSLSQEAKNNWGGRWLLSHESVQMWHTTFSPPMSIQAAWVKLAIKSTKQLFFLTSFHPQTIRASFHPASASLFSFNHFPGFILWQFWRRIMQVQNHQKGYLFQTMNICSTRSQGIPNSTSVKVWISNKHYAWLSRAAIGKKKKLQIFEGFFLSSGTGWSCRQGYSWLLKA